MKTFRDGLTIVVTAPTELLADNLERLFKTWPDPDAPLTHDLGDLTAYNAARAALMARRDAIQDEIDLVDTANDPDARAKVDALIAQRDAVTATLRASARPDV